MNSKTTLLAALPIFLILGALGSAVVFFPNSFDIRPRASQSNLSPLATPTARPTLSLTPTASFKPTIGCSDLYNPVCGADDVTYDSACAAAQAGTTIAYSTPCVVLRQSPTSSPSATPPTPISR